jgi:hypothetical protein
MTMTAVALDRGYTVLDLTFIEEPTKRWIHAIEQIEPGALGNYRPEPVPVTVWCPQGYDCPHRKDAHVRELVGDPFAEIYEFRGIHFAFSDGDNHRVAYYYSPNLL